MKCLLNHGSFRENTIFRSFSYFTPSEPRAEFESSGLRGKSQKGLFNYIPYKYSFYESEANLFLMFADKTGTSSDVMGQGSDLLKIPDYLQGGHRTLRRVHGPGLRRKGFRGGDLCKKDTIP